MTSDPIKCNWFALCDNDAVGHVEHPVIGLVPACESCVERLDLTIAQPLDDEATE